MVLEVATPTFDPASVSDVQSAIQIFQAVFNFIIQQFTNLLNFMLSNPLLMIALGVITAGAVIAIFKRIAR